MELTDEQIKQIKHQLTLDCFAYEEGEIYRTFPRVQNCYAKITDDAAAQEQFAKEISFDFSKVNLSLYYKPPDPIPRPRIFIRTKLRRDPLQLLDQKSLYTFPEILDAVRVVYFACEKLATTPFLLTGDNKEILEFNQFQEKLQQKAEGIIVVLRHWRKSLIEDLHAVLQKIGLGWYDIEIDTWEIYYFSKISSLIQRIRHMVESNLRKMVLCSKDAFIKWLTTPCESTLRIPDEFKWEGSLIVSDFSRAPALFHLLLIIDPFGVKFSYDPKIFSVAALDHFDKSILQSHFIKIIDSEIMKNLMYDYELCYSSVGMLDTELVEARSYLALCYHKSFVALKAYARRYEEHVGFYLCDSETYLAYFTPPETSVIVLRDAILYNMKMRTYTEETLPDDIVIGPYFLLTLPIKQFLIKKRSDILRKLMKILNQNIRDKVYVIVESYRGIYSRLTDPPINIVVLNEIQEWMDTIPVHVKVNEEAMKLVLYDYDILDEFLINMTDADFGLRWEALQWPGKIFKQISYTIENQVLDVERFKKEQTSDLVVFESTIEVLNAEVASFRFLHDINEAIKLSKQCTSVTEKITEAIETARLLNKKQELLKLAELNFDHLSQMLEAFEPFVTFWRHAADLITLTRDCHEKPLGIISIEAINSHLATLDNALIALMELFVDLPKIQDAIQQLQGRIIELKETLTVLECLKHPCWTRVCYERYGERSGREIEYTRRVSLGMCLEAGMLENFHVLEEILSFAIEEDRLQREEERRLQELLRTEEEIINQRRQRRLMRTDI